MLDQLGATLPPRGGAGPRINTDHPASVGPELGVAPASIREGCSPSLPQTLLLKQGIFNSTQTRDPFRYPKPPSPWSHSRSEWGGSGRGVNTGGPPGTLDPSAHRGRKKQATEEPGIRQGAHGSQNLGRWGT